MAETRRFALNVLMNWMATGVGMLVPFFLTPVVVRHLGPAAYGVWILSAATVSYLNLLDLGMRSAVIRFVSKAWAQGAIEELRAVVAAALWFRLLIAAVVAVASVVLAINFPRLFKIPTELHHPAQMTVLLCALGVAVSLVSGVFGAVLAAMNRFDRLSTITMLQTVLRASGVLVILSRGGGLIALAYWELMILVLVGLAVTLTALKTVPSCRVRVRRPDPVLLRQIWSYSLVTFLWIIAVQVIINSDNLMVGHFISVELAAFYAIGGSLVTYSGQVVSALSTTFTPMASGMEANGRMDDVRRLLIRGTQATLALSMPITLALLFRGRTFIGLWMGPSYAHVSGTVLQILLIAGFMSTAASTAGAVMMAIGRHKRPAQFAMVEAAVNVALTLLLVRRMGMFGVAWGTSIAITLVSMAFWPGYIKKVLGIPVGTMVWQGWLKPVLCAVPFGVVCWLADRAWHPANLAIFFLQIFVTLPVYVVSVGLVFREPVLARVREWRASRRNFAEVAAH